jgi:hypothetical protein
MFPQRVTQFFGPAGKLDKIAIGLGEFPAESADPIGETTTRGHLIQVTSFPLSSYTGFPVIVYLWGLLHQTTFSVVVQRRHRDSTVVKRRFECDIVGKSSRYQQIAPCEAPEPIRGLLNCTDTGGAMPTLEEARKRQEDLINYLTKLQREKLVAAPRRKDIVQRQINSVAKEIGKLDRTIQELATHKHFER